MLRINLAGHLERAPRPIVPFTEIVEALTPEEAVMLRTLKAAREVQTYLWGEADGSFGLEEWRRVFRKRVAKIDDIDVTKPHAVVELRKRLLQNAALSIALLTMIEAGKVPPDQNAGPSALPEYAK